MMIVLAEQHVHNDECRPTPLSELNTLTEEGNEILTYLLSKRLDINRKDLNGC